MDHIRNLREICTITAGQSPESKFYNTKGDGLPFYQGKKRFTDRFIGEPVKWTRKVTKEALPGDVLMSVRAPVGPVNFATIHCCIGRGLASIRAGVNLDKNYLFYFLQKHETEIEATEGAVFNSINKTQIGRIKIPIPPLPEQHRIVAILDKAFAAIDQAKANIERNIENAKELFQSKLDEVFTKHGENWSKKPLGWICDNLDSMRVPITKSKRKPGDIPYYGASGVVDYVDDYLFNEDLLLVSEDGANLLARTYPIAFSISGKSWVNNHAHVLRFKERDCQTFVEYYLNSIPLDDYVSGMAQPKLNQKKLNSIPIPYPDIEVQRGVVNAFGELLGHRDELLEVYEQKKNMLDELKQSLLQKAFCGELTQLSLSA